MQKELNAGVSAPFSSISEGRLENRVSDRRAGVNSQASGFGPFWLMGYIEGSVMAEEGK